MDRDIQELHQLIRLGSEPRNRTLANFRNIVKKMEAIDPRAPKVDLVAALVHLGFYWRGKGTTSVLEDLSGSRLFDFPKDNYGRLIQDQLQISDKLRGALTTSSQELRDYWIVIPRPGDGEPAHLGHAMAMLECRMRSGRFKSWLYGYGGDYLKWISDRFKPDAEHKLDPPDWAGDELGDELVRGFNRTEPTASLSQILAAGEGIAQTVFVPSKPVQPRAGVGPRDAGPPPGIGRPLVGVPSTRRDAGPTIPDPTQGAALILQKRMAVPPFASAVSKPGIGLFHPQGIEAANPGIEFARRIRTQEQARRRQEAARRLEQEQREEQQRKTREEDTRRRVLEESCRREVQEAQRRQLGIELARIKRPPATTPRPDFWPKRPSVPAGGSVISSVWEGPIGGPSQLIYHVHEPWPGRSVVDLRPFQTRENTVAP